MQCKIIEDTPDQVAANQRKLVTINSYKKHYGSHNVYLQISNNASIKLKIYTQQKPLQSTLSNVLSKQYRIHLNMTRPQKKENGMYYFYISIPIWGSDLDDKIADTLRSLLARLNKAEDENH